MIKKIIIALVLLAVVVAGSVGYVFYNLNNIIATFKPDAEKKVSQIIGTPFVLGDLKVSLFPRAQVSIDKVSLGKTDTEAGFSLKNVFLDVNLSKLLSKELEISRLLVTKPEVTLVRDAKGIRIEGLPQPSTKASSSSTATAPSNNKTTAAVAAPLPMSLKSLEIQDAQLTFDDRILGKKLFIRPVNIKLALSIEGTIVQITSLEVDGKALDLLPFKVKARDLSFDQENGKAKIAEILSSALSAEFAINGEVDIKAFAGDFALKTKQALNLSSLASLYNFLPEKQKNLLSSFDLQGSVAPELTSNFKLPADIKARGGVTLSNLAAKVAAFAVTSLSGNIGLTADLSSQKLESKNISLSLNGSPVTVEFSSALNNFKQAQLSQLAIKAFGGEVTASGKAELAPKLPYSADIQISGIQISQALAVVSQSAAKFLDGTVKSVIIKAYGIVDQAPALEAQATGTAQIVNARLVGINVAGLVLKAVDNLPVFNMSLYSMIPASDRAAFDEPDTRLDTIDAQYALKEGTLNLQKLAMSGPLFSLTGSGTASLDMRVDMKAVITFTSTVTNLMLQTNPKIKNILDARGQLVLPLSISGTAPKLIIIPDISKVAELAAEKVLKEQGQKLLEGALDKATKNQSLKGILGF